MHLPIGFSLQKGKYIVEKVLGQGGFGITYLASYPGSLLMPKVAIKEFFPCDYCSRNASGLVHITTGVSKDDISAFREKFKKEAMNLYKLSHDNIVKVTDLFEENGTVYYVMEHIEGCSLHSFVSENGALSEAEALRIIRQIAEALTYLHSKKMMHLDVKPGNVMIRERSHDALLIDFGLAKRYSSAGVATSSSPIGISAGFAPLEQYSSASISTFAPETDIYSLGATLYFMLTGKVPAAAVDRVINHALDFPAAVSPRVRKAIVAAMQIDTKLRPASVADFLALLEGSAVTPSKKTVSIPSPKAQNVTLPLNEPEIKKKKNSIVAYLITNTVIGLIFLCLFLFVNQFKVFHELKDGFFYHSSYAMKAIIDSHLFPEFTVNCVWAAVISTLLVILIPYFHKIVRRKTSTISCLVFTILSIFFVVLTDSTYPENPGFIITLLFGLILLIVNATHTRNQFKKS